MKTKSRLQSQKIGINRQKQVIIRRERIGGVRKEISGKKIWWAFTKRHLLYSMEGQHIVLPKPFTKIELGLVKSASTQTQEWEETKRHQDNNRVKELQGEHIKNSKIPRIILPRNTKIPIVKNFPLQK